MSPEPIFRPSNFKAKCAKQHCRKGKRYKVWRKLYFSGLVPITLHENQRNF